MSSLVASVKGPGAEGQVHVGFGRLDESSLLRRSVGHDSQDDQADEREQTADEREANLSYDEAS